MTRPHHHGKVMYKSVLSAESVVINLRILELLVGLIRS